MENLELNAVADLNASRSTLIELTVVRVEIDGEGNVADGHSL